MDIHDPYFIIFSDNYSLHSLFNVCIVLFK